MLQRGKMTPKAGDDGAPREDCRAIRAGSSCFTSSQSCSSSNKYDLGQYSPLQVTHDNLSMGAMQALCEDQELQLAHPCYSSTCSTQTLGRSPSNLPAGCLHHLIKTKSIINICNAVVICLDGQIKTVYLVTRSLATPDGKSNYPSQMPRAPLKTREYSLSSPVVYSGGLIQLRAT